MKTQYTLLSKGPACPAVYENDKEEIVIVGSLLSEDEQSDMTKKTSHKVAPYEKVVRIPRDVFNAAIDKLLTKKNGK